MKLHEMLSIMNWNDEPRYSVYVMKDENSHSITDSIIVGPGTAPDYTGQIWSKSQRETIKTNRQKLKAYKDCEVLHCSIYGYLNIYVNGKA